MKVCSILSFAFAVSFFFVSCNSEKKKYSGKSEYLRPATIEYSAQDSAEIRQLVSNYVEAFSNKDYKATSEMLYKVRNDSIIPLDSREKAAYVEAYNHMSIYGCKLKSLVLRSDRNNEVKLTVQIVSSGDLDNEVGVTHLSLNPVLKDGKWYLTLLDKNAEGVEDVYKKR